jgi:hypothetical protein
MLRPFTGDTPGSGATDRGKPIPPIPEAFLLVTVIVFETMEARRISGPVIAPVRIAEGGHQLFQLLHLVLNGLGTLLTLPEIGGKFPIVGLKDKEVFGRCFQQEKEGDGISAEAKRENIFPVPV